MQRYSAPRTFIALVVLLSVALAGEAHAEKVYVYGPGGPAPAMKELATAFAKSKGIEVGVAAGPTDEWLVQAKTNAHVIFSGSENMMLGFIAAFDGQIDQLSIEPIYLRPSTILVRKGNPKAIKGIRDLAEAGMKVMVTEGAGQIGMWEDVVGRNGELSLLKNFRRNIVEFAANSGLARKSWVEKPDIDAWLIWNHWQIANPEIADQVAVEPELTVWRSTDIALTERGTKSPAAVAFVDFVKSLEGEAIFKKWGWRR